MAFFCLNVTYPPPKGSLASKVIYICNLRSSTTYSCSRNWPGCSLDLRYVVLLGDFLPARFEASFARSLVTRCTISVNPRASIGLIIRKEPPFASKQTLQASTHIRKRASTLRQQASNVSFVSPQIYRHRTRRPSYFRFASRQLFA